MPPPLPPHQRASTRALSAQDKMGTREREQKANKTQARPPRSGTNTHATHPRHGPARQFAPGTPPRAGASGRRKVGSADPARGGTLPTALPALLGPHQRTCGRPPPPPPQAPRCVSTHPPTNQQSPRTAARRVREVDVAQLHSGEGGCQGGVARAVGRAAASRQWPTSPHRRVPARMGRRTPMRATPGQPAASQREPPRLRERHTQRQTGPRGGGDGPERLRRDRRRASTRPASETGCHAGGCPDQWRKGGWADGARRTATEGVRRGGVSVPGTRRVNRTPPTNNEQLATRTGPRWQSWLGKVDGGG